MAAFQDRSVTVGRLRLHYLDWGAPKGKPDMLLLHGGGQNAHSWDEFSLAMRKDYHVIALDQRGHGDSDWSPRAIYTTRAHMGDIGGFVRQVGLRRFVLAGLSMGGRNALTYAALHPEQIERLVIVDIGPETMHRGGRAIQEFRRKADILPTFDAFIERARQFNPRRSVEQLRERLRWHLRQLPDGRWTWKNDRRYGNRQQDALPAKDLWPAVRKIGAPTLLVRGMESDVLAGDAARRMQQAMRQCTLVEVAGAGHTVPGDKPEAFAAAVRKFLELPLKGG